MANETDLFRYSAALPEGSGGDTFHLLLSSLQQSRPGFLQWDPHGHRLCRCLQKDGCWGLMAPFGPEDGSHANVATVGVWWGSCPDKSPAAGRTLPGGAGELRGAGGDGMATSKKSYSMRGGIQNMN